MLTRRIDKKTLLFYLFYPQIKGQQSNQVVSQCSQINEQEKSLVSRLYLLIKNNRVVYEYEYVFKQIKIQQKRKQFCHLFFQQLISHQELHSQRG